VCECNLFLTCAKFITTPKYAPRLRHCYATELALADKARTQGWVREVECHQFVARRICKLLTSTNPWPSTTWPTRSTGDLTTVAA
jgi:hypothetical protein